VLVVFRDVLTVSVTMNNISVMLNINKTIVLLLLLFNVFVSIAQTIECERMEFYFFPTIGEEIEEAGLGVKAFLNVENIQNDTIKYESQIILYFQYY
jgi:hypothetical protein